jgi:2,4-didehydro-3-deoxy-L-rhamnonate hydrolase
MRIAAYDENGTTMIGRVTPDGTVHRLTTIERFWKNPAAEIAANAEPVGPLSALSERPAVPATAQVICIGLNYRKHAQESNLPIPEVPVIFGRWARTLSTSGTPVPQVDPRFDWEGELGVVIGQRMFAVDAEQASAGIFGYVAFNDISGRSFQLQTPQWTFGKNSAASGPMSPIVTADEVGDPAQGLRLQTRVNGRTVQDSTTADMIFTVPQIIAHVSRAIPLEPGDLIVTGTPEGVGIATGTFLQPGDVVEVEIQHIGVVRSPIVAGGGAVIPDA